MKSIFIAFATLFLLTACSKENDNTICIDGVINWAGNPAADGLGWVINKDDSINTRPYVPQNLSGSFKKDGLKVAVCLQKTLERVACNCVGPIYKYRITSIRVR